MNPELSLTIIAVLTIIGFLAAFIQRTSGFAFGVVILCLLPHIITYSDAIIVAKIGSFFMALVFFVTNRKYFRWSVAKYVLPTAIVMDFLGIKLAKMIGVENLKVYLGFFLIFIGLQTLLKKDKETLQPTLAHALLFGSLWGGCSGLFGAGGPFLAKYTSSLALSKDEYFATTQGMIVASLTLDVIVRISSGLVRVQALKVCALIIPGVIIGAVLGNILFHHINAVTMHKIVNAVIAFNGVIIVFNNL